jgi:glycosyltransferase involved in cell wall biosynthesis
VNPAYLKQIGTQEQIRRQLDLPLDRHLVLHVARFQEIKGHHHLLEALLLLVARMDQKAPLVLFAGGVLEPASRKVLEYKARVERLAAQAQLQPHVRFLGPRRDVPLLMRAADVVVSPSDFESFGMTLIEAMTVATPIVATMAGGPSEILKHEKTGLLVPPADPVAMAAGIARLLEQPEFAQTLAAAARDVAMDRYAPRRRAQALIREYQDLLSH